MSEPLRGLLHDLDHRCSNLITDFRRDRSGEVPEIQAYVARLLGLVQRASDRVRALLADPDFQDESIAQHLLYNYKRLAEFVQSMEVGPAFVLARFNDSDRAASRLIARICEDIGFPHNAPLCSATSADYYWTRVDVDLVYMPFTETRHVLTWPDLYHELAHILVGRDRYNILVPCEDTTIRYFQQQFEEAKSKNWPTASVELLREAAPKWLNIWLLEFCCDMIAAYCAGPAYGWCNLRLCANQGLDATSVYGGNPTHPADWARAQAVDVVLQKTGWPDASSAILKDLDDLIKVSLSEPLEGFDLTYPIQLIEAIAATVIDYCEQSPLKGFSEGDLRNGPTQRIHEAWIAFREAPDQFATKERTLSRQLLAPSPC